MKKLILNISICLLAMLTIVSCEDYLEEIPVSEVLLTEVNESNIDAIAFGMYEPLTRSRGRIWESLYGTDIILLNEAIQSRSGSRNRTANYDLERSDAKKYWPTLYESVGRANSLLAALEQSDVEESIKNLAQGEASFVRALVYFTLVRTFGEVPMRLDPVTNPDDTGQPLETIDNIYAQIIADLLVAEDYLPATTNFPGRATAGAAKVFLADVYLMRGLFTEAAAKAKEVIDNASTYGYALLPNFADIFSATADTHAEDVFSLKFSQAIAMGTFIPTYWAPRRGELAPKGGIAARGLERGGIRSSTPIIQRWDDNDQRKAWTMYDSLMIDGVMEFAPNTDRYDFMMGKYKDPGAVEETAAGNDWYLYRYADALLIFAEADNRANGSPSTEAYDAINQIRRRAFKVEDNSYDLSGLSTTEFDDAVIDERAWEFLGEGKRWHDLVRTGRWETVIPEAGWSMPTQMYFDIPDAEQIANPEL
jgi:hypothetical protein